MDDYLMHESHENNLPPESKFHSKGECLLEKDDFGLSFNNDDLTSAWISPVEQSQTSLSWKQRALAAVELLVIIVTLSLGSYILFVERVNEKWKSMYIYVVASLIADFLLATCIGLFLFCIQMWCGSTSMRHALAGCSLLLRFIEVLLCYVLLVCAIYFLCFYLHRLKLEPNLFCYMCLQILITSSTVLESLPTIYKSLHYVVDLVRHRNDLSVSPSVVGIQINQNRDGYSLIGDYSAVPPHSELPEEINEKNVQQHQNNQSSFVELKNQSNNQ